MGLGGDPVTHKNISVILKKSKLLVYAILRSSEGAPDEQAGVGFGFRCID